MGLLIDAALTAAMVSAFAFASVLLGPRDRAEGDHDLPFETGLRPLDRAQENMSVLYIKYAVLFVVFDVDLAFLLPWVSAGARAGLDAMLALTVFLALVAFMLAYIWRKGALECG